MREILRQGESYQADVFTEPDTVGGRERASERETGGDFKDPSFIQNTGLSEKTILPKLKNGKTTRQIHEDFQFVPVLSRPPPVVLNTLKAFLWPTCHRLGRDWNYTMKTFTYVFYNYKK